MKNILEKYCHLYEKLKKKQIDKINSLQTTLSDYSLMWKLQQESIFIYRNKSYLNIHIWQLFIGPTRLTSCGVNQKYQQ